MSDWTTEELHDYWDDQELKESDDDDIQDDYSWFGDEVGID